MTPQEILNIVEAFFKAVLKVLEALGFIEPEAPAEGTEETPEA